jgi:hypothetical protein
MTQSNLPVLPTDLDTGLEDFSAEDLRMPRLAINHDNGTFKDTLSGAEYPALVVITLGLIKQRVMWHPTLKEGDSVPLCKSTNYKVGYPTTKQPNAADNFPWGASGWNPSDFQPDEEGRLNLPCESCRFKEWKSHPDGKKTWCSEQHTIPLLYAPLDPSDPNSVMMEPGMQALYTAQRSSLAASKTFFAAIVRQNEPAYSVKARLTLMAQTRGKNTYYTPVFTIMGRTDVNQWPTYSDTYRTIREFVSRPPATRDADGNIIQNLQQSNVVQGSVVPQYDPSFQQQSWAPQQPVQQQAQPVYQQPAQAPVYQQPAPVVAQPQPVQQVQQPVYQQPVQQTPPLQPPLPVQQPVNPVPAGPSSARDADDDLPF